MTPRTKALAASSPAILGLLAQLWRHRAALNERATDVMIRLLARRDKAADW